MKLLYELQSPDSKYSYIGFTSNPETIISEWFVRPLCGFEGDGYDKVESYVKDNNTFFQKPEPYESLIIYLITCKDPAIKESYVGQSCQVNIRVGSHEDSSYLETCKKYKFIRSHGGWDNWNLKPLGTYKCFEIRDHAERMEWFWWKKLGSELNSKIPGKKVVQRDKQKMKLTPLELYKVYSNLERCIHVDYHGNELPPVLSEYISVDFDYKPKPLPKPYKPIMAPTMRQHEYRPWDVSESDESEESESEEVDDGIRVCLYHVVCDDGDESYLGILSKPFTLKNVIKDMKRCVFSKRALRFIESNGDWGKWRAYVVKEECSLRDYHKLMKLVDFKLNNLTRDGLKLMCPNFINELYANNDICVPTHM